MRYRRAGTVQEAVALLAGGGVPLAGGTVIVPQAMQAGQGPDVVDISGIAALRELAFDRATTRIGALVTIARVVDDPALASHTALRAAAAEIGNPHVRRMGTVGGNIGSRAYPDLLPALIALDATVILSSKGGEERRSIEDVARDGVPAGSLVVCVEVPREERRSAFRKFAWRRSSGRTVVSVAASTAFVGGVPKRPRVAVGGICQPATRLSKVEALLGEASWTRERVDAAARTGAEETPADVVAHPSIGYRRQLVEAGLRAALLELMEQAP